MRTRFLALLLATSALAQAASAASLRDMVTLSGPLVRLSDLFADAGAGANRVLGPGPAPGGRIVVQAAQLAAIAEQYGVDWKPASPADQVILERPGRAMPRATLLTALRPFLADAGAGQDCDIELSGLNPPLVDPHDTTAPEVDQLTYDAASHRFSAIMTIGGGGAAAQRLRLAGRAFPTATLPIATHRLSPGAVVGPDDVQIARVHVDLQRGAVARRLDQALGMQTLHGAEAGKPLLLDELTRAPLVLKGGRVAVSISTGALSVTEQGLALQSGGMGDHVQVLNPISRAMMDGIVTGPGNARVEPGSMPILPRQPGQPPDMMTAGIAQASFP